MKTLNESMIRQIVAEALKEAIDSERRESECISEIESILGMNSDNALNESFTSGKISQLISQHGGVKVVTSPNPFFKSKMDLSKITDDMIMDIRVFPESNAYFNRDAAYKNSVDSITPNGRFADEANGIRIEMNDGTLALIKIKNGIGTPKPNYLNPNNQNNRYTNTDGAVPRYSMKKQNFYAKNPAARADAERTFNHTMDANRFKMN